MSPYCLQAYKLQTLKSPHFTENKTQTCLHSNMVLRLLGPAHPVTSPLLLPTYTLLSSLGPCDRSLQRAAPLLTQVSAQTSPAQGGLP